MARQSIFFNVQAIDVVNPPTGLVSSSTEKLDSYSFGAKILELQHFKRLARSTAHFKDSL
jgi:hypothetical protein